MLLRLVGFFVVLLLLDLALLVRIGMEIGVWPTISLVVVTGALGLWLARTRGARVLRGMRTEMSVGQMPSTRLLDGFLIIVGAILLLIPGLLTDLMGLALLLPWTQRRLRASVRRRTEKMARSGQFRGYILRG